MKVVFDGRTFLQKKSGIGAFSFELIKHMSEKWEGCAVTIIAPHTLHETFINLNTLKNVTIYITPKWLRIMPNMLWFFFFSSYFVRKLKADVYISPVTQYPFFLPHNTNMVIMNHDFVIKEYAETMTLRNRISCLLFDFSIKRANNIWCNSDYTKEKLLEYFPQKKDANLFVGLTVSDIYRKVSLTNEEREKVVKKYFGKNIEGFVLFVGSLEPRKNLKYLIKLAPSIYQISGMPVLIVGSAKWKSQIEEMADSNCIVIVDHFVEDAELLLLYNLASCYVSTSLNEGFGMPQLEAMRCGCPVVSPNNSAMAEVVGDYGRLIEGWDEDIWVRSIIEECKKAKKPFYSEKYCWDHILYGLRNYLKEI